MPISVKWHLVEFYEGDLDHKIMTREGLHFIPREGETMALGPDIFEVKFVSFNLDYMGTDYEVWRANVVMERLYSDRLEGKG